MRCRDLRGKVFPLAVCIWLGSLAALQAQTVTGVTPADWPSGIVSPIAVNLPAGDWGKDALVATVQVEGASESKKVAAQVEPADPRLGTPPRAWLLWAAGPVDRGRKINITFEKSPALKTAYTSKYTEPLLTISPPDSDPILTFYHGRPEPGLRYPLTDYINPLIGLDGETLTVSRPTDHVHHRGVYWAWVRHEQEGKSIGDWWHPKDMHLDSGPIQHTDGPVLSRFASQHTWVYDPREGKPEPVLSEWAICRVFSTTNAGRAVDVEIVLTPLVDHFKLGGTLELEKGYGGFTFRYATVTSNTIEIYADGKKIPKDLNQLRATWADYSAIFLRRPGQPNKQRTGVAVLVNPQHPDFPPEWITRFYGVLNVSYPGLKMLELPKGQPLRLRYRLWIHRGNAVEGQVDAAYKAYAGDWQWRPFGTTQTAPGM